MIMLWTRMGRVCGVALAVAGVVIASRPASAQDYERVLAGVRLNSSAKSVLARYGNPNEVIIGDVGVRQAPPQPGGGAAAGGMMGSSGMMGGPGMMSGGMMGGAATDDVGMGGGGGKMMPGAMGMTGMGGGPPMGGMSGPMGGPMGSSGMMGGPSMGMGGPDMGAAYGRGPGGMSGPMGGPMGSSGMSGPMGGGMGGPSVPGGEDFPGAPGGGTGVGQFGQTVSTLARQQEVTWIYNRKIANNLVSYEFLIGPSGNVSQIRVSGYKGGNAKTKRGAVLGSTYKQVVALYGYPEEHYQVGRILVASYRKNKHVQFQFMNERGQANPMSDGNKVVAITIATVE
jgi:hypothetical protein